MKKKKSRSIARKVFKGIGIVIGVLLFLLLLLRLPVIQTKLANIATKKLSKQLNTTIVVDKIAINFIDNANLKGIYVEDQNQDTLLYCQNINVELGFWKLLSKQIEIDDISLNTGIIGIQQGSDSIFNFQFLIDHFASEPKSEQSPSEISFDIKRISLSDINISGDLLSSQNNITLEELFIKISSFDLNDNVIEFETFRIEQARISSIVELSDTMENHTQSVQSIEELAFPLRGLPITVRSENFSILNSQIKYAVQNAEPTLYFNPDYMDVSHLELQVSSFELDSSHISTSIENLHFYLNDVFVLNELQSDILIDDEVIRFSDINIKTAESEASVKADIQFNTFTDLSRKLEKLPFNIMLNKLEISMPEISYFWPDIDQIEELKPFRKKKLLIQGSAMGSLHNLKLNNLVGTIAETQLSINGNLSNLADINDLGFENLRINGRTSHKDFQVFIPDQNLKSQTKALGVVTLNTIVDGNMNEINFSEMILDTDAQLSGIFQGKIIDLMHRDRLSFDLAIQNITTGNNDFQVFMDSIPDLLAPFDTINYQGIMKGNLTAIELDGELTTSLGNLNTDLDIELNKDYSNAQYIGKIDLRNFKLGEFLKNDSLDRISMVANVNGQGLSLDSIKAAIDGAISSIDYNSYNYHDIQLNGLIEGKKFRGKASMKDKNLAFTFDGEVDYSDSIPDFAFDFTLDTINVSPLNLIEEAYRGSLSLKANLTGLEIDNIEGSVIVHDINLWNGDKQLRSDSMTLIALKESGNRNIAFDSKYVRASAKGDFLLSLLPDVVLDFLDQYFPLRQFLGQTVKKDTILNQEELKIGGNDLIALQINFENVQPLLSFFEIPITRVDSSYLKFELDAPNNLSSFEISVPALEYDGYFLDSIYAHASNENKNALAGKLTIDSIYLAESIHLSQANIDFRFKEQKALIDAHIDSKKDFESLGFTAEITSASHNDFQIHLMDHLTLNNTSWTINADGPVLFGNNTLEIPITSFNNKQELLLISGNDSILLLDFQSFNLNNIAHIIDVDSLNVAGQMNGSIELGINEDLPILGNLRVNDINFNEYNIGNLSLTGNKAFDKARAEINLTGEEVQMRGALNYDLVSENLYGELDLEKLKLESFNPFVSSYAKDLKGTLFGKIFVTDELSDPIIGGSIYFNNVSAFINDLETIYTIKEGSLKLADGILTPILKLSDEKERLSYLAGTISHDNYENFKLNLNYNADKFTFLNSPRNSKQLFYGRLVGQVKASITGPLELPKIDAKVTALEETDLTIQMLGSEAVLTEEDYIVFYDANKVSTPEDIDSIAQLSYNNENSFDLDLELLTDSKAKFHVIIDPITGDKLDISGTSDLFIKLPSDGDLTINGEYTVVNGTYSVSYENTIRRNFVIDANSKIIFQGDPYNAKLDLRAVYKTRTSLEALANSASSLGNEEISGLKEDVNIILDIGGTILKPELNFNIEIPETSSSPVGSNVTAALNSIKQNETRLLEEVFSIILFNSFTGGTSGGNLDNFGAAQAVSSVGNLINDQLNKLARNARGLEVNFDLDQYRNSKESNSNITEIDLGLSQRLFDDRLIISAEGNANLESNSAANSNFTSLAGDFIIQYLLTKDGKYRIKVFQKSDYNALSNESVWKTGVGLTYKTRFGKINKKQEKDEY